MRVAILLFLFLCAVPQAAAQYAEPAGVRRLGQGAPDPHLSQVTVPGPRTFRGERIGVGALIGMIIVAPIGWLVEQGACEANNCGSGARGLAAGAAVGAVLGGLFGLIAALPPRTD